MALQFNLASVVAKEQIRSAQGTQVRTRSALLPDIAVQFSEAQRQVNLAAFGFGGVPGARSVAGPFSVFDARVSLSQAIFDLRALNENRAATLNVQAAQRADNDAREWIVLLSGSLYLQAAAGESRIAAARAQMESARALYELARNRKEAGVAAGIDVLRAQVELQAQQQRLIVAENEFAQRKLNLAQAIGLPLGQQFTLTDSLRYHPAPVLTVERALEQAYEMRADFQAARARMRAGELSRRAAAAAALPTLDVNGDYGVIGRSAGSSHGSFTVGAALRIPVFQGGRVRGAVMQAEALLKQRTAEVQELRGRIYYEVQAAFLDLQAAGERVKVAESAVDLARRQVAQSQDRFSEGVANNVEVVQAQGALATAEENYIASLYAHGLAKGALARALGVAESSFEEFVNGK
jgi:outer membrane protein TolC